MRIFRLSALVVMVLAIATGAFAQAVVTAADITRLDSTADEIAGRLAEIQKSDPTLATEVSQGLTDLRDEVTYLRVKLRREGAIPREEYASVRDRLETLRVRADGQRVAAQPVLGDPEPPSLNSLPVGTEFDVRLQTSLSSATAQVE
jgi:hypothetical protein